MVDGGEETPFAKAVNSLGMIPSGVETPLGDDITQLAQRIVDM